MALEKDASPVPPTWATQSRVYPIPNWSVHRPGVVAVPSHPVATTNISFALLEMFECVSVLAPEPSSAIAIDVAAEA